jgi:hypothetical protein
MSDVRTYYCEVTGVAMPYSGRGRPPRFCEAVRLERQKEQRRQASKRAREKKAEKRAALRSDSVSRASLEANDAARAAA